MVELAQGPGLKLQLDLLQLIFTASVFSQGLVLLATEHHPHQPNRSFRLNWPIYPSKQAHEAGQSFLRKCRGRTTVLSEPGEQLTVIPEDVIGHQKQERFGYSAQLLHDEVLG